MLTTGYFRQVQGEKQFNAGLMVEWGADLKEVALIIDRNVVCAYKTLRDGSEYCFGDIKARAVYQLISRAVKGCNGKNGVPAPFALGTVTRHTVTTRSGLAATVDRYNTNDLAGLNLVREKESDNITVYLEFDIEKQALSIPGGVPYIKLTVEQEFDGANANDNIPVRTLEEISLIKDVSWLKNKRYYIVNDESTAEQLFTALEKFDGAVAYDTETTGLRINMFGKINSKWERMLKEYNEEHKDAPIRTDKLVGIIFCVEEHTSYYIPAANRKFRNLYEDINNPITAMVANNIKAKYTVGELAGAQTDMADYIRKTPISEWGPDIILMERVRGILETRSLTGHNIKFDWKVGWLYDINTNFKDDTLIMHQLMYKFRSTTSNRGEPSDLKTLTRVELGIEQLELSDFFSGYSEEEEGAAVKSRRKLKKKDKAHIDFSYMDYDGARAYGPADGDFSLGLFRKYKIDLLKNHRELEYLYQVEVIVAKAIAYMEFYGHRIDETKIEATRVKLEAEKVELEKQIRHVAGLADGEELNIASPAQMASLFYDRMGIQTEGGQRSVAKKTIKSIVSLKNEDGTLKYPAVKLYSDWKKVDTQLTKFFDNLQDFMYPGGFIFSSYGQISTATGRMSCKKPNAQQYPKQITSITVPRDGCVMADMDYSQIEYRCLVALAKEMRMLEEFKDPDNDYHTLKASQMFGVDYALVTPSMRSDSKSFNFGIPYGMGFKSLAILLTGMSGDAQVEEAKAKYELYFKDQPLVREFFANVKEAAMVNKYTQTHFGRRRYYSFVDKDGKLDHKRKGAALRQAGNACIQGTAADIYKIAVARVFTWIVKNGLLGAVYLTNMVHDEMLFEIDCSKVNTLRAVGNLIERMEFHLDGFPPLYVGAGVGSNWAEAKGKMAEIHPHLGQQLVLEAMDGSEASKQTGGEPEAWLKFFNERVFNFRRQKIINYLLDDSNRGKAMHPAIGSLLNLQFTSERVKNLLKENPNYYAGRETDETLDILRDFIEDNQLGVKAEWYTAGGTQDAQEAEEDDWYEDEDDEDIDELEGGVADHEFALIDEDESLYGVDINELIRTFGYLVSETNRICGIDIDNVPFSKRDELYAFIEEHACEPDDEKALRVAFLRPGNVLVKTDVYVKGIKGSELSARLRVNSMSGTTSVKYVPGMRGA